MASLWIRVVLGIGAIWLFPDAVHRSKNSALAAAALNGQETSQYTRMNRRETAQGAAKTTVVQNGHNDRDFFYSHLSFTGGDETLLSFGSGSYAAWEVSSGRKLFQRAYPGSVCAKHSLLSPDGKHMVVFLTSGDVAYMDIMTGRVVRLHRNRCSVDSCVTGSAFRSAHSLMFIHMNRRSKVMNVLTGEILEECQSLPDSGDAKPSDGTSFSPRYRWTVLDMSADGRYVLASRRTVSHDDKRSPCGKCLRVFDMDKDVIAGTFRGERFGRIGTRPVFSPDEKTVLVYGYGYDRKRRGMIANWDFRNDHESLVFRENTPGSVVLAFGAFLPDSKTVRIVVGGRPAQYRNIDTGDEVSVPFPEDAVRFALSRNGRYLALATKNGDIGLYTAPCHEKVWQREGWRNSTPTCLDVSPDGDGIAIGLRNKVVLWCLSGKSPVHVLDHPGVNDIIAADYSPDGKRMVTGTKNTYETDQETGNRVVLQGRATVWNIEHEEPDWVIPTTAERVDSVRFHPNGHLILTGGTRWETGGEIALWDVKTRGVVRRYGEKADPSHAGTGGA